MTGERAPTEVLKVSATSKPVAVAGAIAGVIRSKGRVEVQAIGAGAINQAVKAIAISRGYVAPGGLDLVCIPAFIDISIDVEEPLERADIAILNTCVVRQASEDRVYSKLHELKEWKTSDRTIAVTGCIVGKEGDVLRGRFPQLDAVVPIGGYDDFLAGLAARYDYSEGEALPPTGRTGVSHYVRVIQGCDHNCTFCI